MDASRRIERGVRWGSRTAGEVVVSGQASLNQMICKYGLVLEESWQKDRPFSVRQELVSAFSFQRQSLRDCEQAGCSGPDKYFNDTGDPRIREARNQVMDAV